MVAVIVLTVGVRYSYQVYKKQISPALSTWLIFLTGVLLSFATYIVAEDKDFQSGILNTADVFTVSIIVFSIVIFGNISVTFKTFEKKYLIGASGIILFWVLSKNSFTSNLLVQIIMVIGYFPTIQNLIKEKRNTESFSAWILVLLAGIIALYPAINGGNLLAVIYASRNISMAGILLGLMFFYHYRIKTNN